MNDRACVYRRQYGIPDEWGTACNIMAMVFGNLGDDCATGVALTRDGSLGARHSTATTSSMPRAKTSSTAPAHQTHRGNPWQGHAGAFKELVEVGKKLEKHYRNMQDIEFTISRNKLYMLQTRNAKRTGFAAVRVATDMVEEGLISKEEAISSKFIPAGDIDQLLLRVRPGGEEEGGRGRQTADQGHPGRARRRDRQDRLLAAEGRGLEAGQPGCRWCWSARRPRRKTCAA